MTVEKIAFRRSVRDGVRARVEARVPARARLPAPARARLPAPARACRISARPPIRPGQAEAPERAVAVGMKLANRLPAPSGARRLAVVSRVAQIGLAPNRAAWADP